MRFLKTAALLLVSVGLLAGWSDTARAQNFSVSGKVTLDDGSPVKGAVVEAIPSREGRSARHAKTGADGTYKIPFAEFGPYQFRASSKDMLMHRMALTIRLATKQVEYETSGEFGPDQKLVEFDVQPGRIVEADFVMVPSDYFTRQAEGNSVTAKTAELREANNLTLDKKYAEAEAIIQKIVDEGHADASAWYLKGLDARGLGRDDDAKGYLSKALELAPETPGAHAQLGLIASDKGDKPTAVDEFRKELAISPDATPVAINLAVTLRDIGRADEAIAAWEHVLEMAPSESGAYVELTTLYTDQKQADKAAEVLRRMESVVKPDPALWFNLGASFANDDKLDRAEVAYAKALALDADFPEANREMGWLRLREGDGATAATFFEKYLALRPNAKDAADVRAALESAKKMKPHAK